MEKTGMVFGVFDGLHKGHQYFLNEAKSLCENLVVVVAQTNTVKEIKKRHPKKTLEERIAAIKEFDPKFTVVEGDSKLGDWTVLKTHKPDIVFVGYDQQSLATELKKLGMKHSFIGPHFPEKFKSSLI